MDEYEQMAADLEFRQTERYRKCRKKIDFWQKRETSIFEAIKSMRSLSKTYDPANPR